MRVTVREKKIKNGRISLYLDYYPPIVIKGKLSRRESLGLYLEKPRTQIEREVNQETRKTAEIKRSQRQILLNNNPNALAYEIEGDFITLYRVIVEDKIQNLKNPTNWKSSLQYFEDFTNGKCSFTQVTSNFAEKYQKYLLTANNFSVRTKNKTYQRNKENTYRISPNSAKNYFQLFKSVVNRAWQKRFIAENPLIEVKPIKSVGSLKEFLTVPELKVLQKTKINMPDNLRRACLFAALTGLRFSDIARLKWFNVRENENEPFLALKIKKTTNATFHPISLEALKLLGERQKEAEQVFSGLRYTSSVNLWLEKWCKKAGIRRITFHCLRHSYASAQLNAGTSAEAISELLGHSNLNVTLGYLHSFGQGKRKAADVISFED